MNQFRSRYEKHIANELNLRGVKYEYETIKIKYHLKKKGKCNDCFGTSVSLLRTYTPDFIFKRGEIIVEAKGRFTSSDRTKMKQVVKEHPGLDIRMLFMRDQWCTKKKLNRYSDWCKKYGVKYAFGVSLPNEWLKEIG
jgi:hypothetical protein